MTVYKGMKADDVDSSLLQSAFLTLVYCMYRIYQMETKIVEEMIDNLT